MKPRISFVATRILSVSPPRYGTVKRGPCYEIIVRRQGDHALQFSKRSRARVSVPLIDLLLLVVCRDQSSKGQGSEDPKAPRLTKPDHVPTRRSTPLSSTGCSARFWSRDGLRRCNWPDRDRSRGTEDSPPRG